MKFRKIINGSNSDTLRSRGSLLAEQAKMEQRRLLDELESKSIDIQLNITKLTDVAPETSISLKPADVNPKEWVRQLHALQVELRLVQVEIEIAKKTLNEWFTEEEPS